MPLFEIPGWSIASDPVVEPQEHGSKKRKRPSASTDKLESMEVNLEKLVKRWKGSSETNEGKNGDGKRVENVGLPLPHKREAKRRGKKSRTDDIEEKKKYISLPKPLKATSMDFDMIVVPPQAKPLKRSWSAVTSSPKTVSPAKNGNSSTTPGLTTLQEGMKRSLDGARFRQVGHSFSAIPVLKYF